MVELPPKPPRPKKPRKGHGRSKLPEELRREERLHPVAEAERQCPSCGGERICIGWEVSETLERIPAEMYIIVDKREKLACHPCEQGVAVAPAPDKVIDKGRPGPGLLADVVIGKYVDHLPLNRQRRIYLRHVLRAGRAGGLQPGGGAAPLVLLRRGAARVRGGGAARSVVRHRAVGGGDDALPPAVGPARRGGSRVDLGRLKRFCLPPPAF